MIVSEEKHVLLKPSDIWILTHEIMIDQLWIECVPTVTFASVLGISRQHTKD